jgi:hypothetical protein
MHLPSARVMRMTAPPCCNHHDATITMQARRAFTPQHNPTHMKNTQIELAFLLI